MSILQELAAFTADMNAQGINVRVDLGLDESIETARKCGVPEDKIIHNSDELDTFLGF